MIRKPVRLLFMHFCSMNPTATSGGCLSTARHVRYAKHYECQSRYSLMHERVCQTKALLNLFLANQDLYGSDMYY